jgi:hypothetical protein
MNNEHPELKHKKTEHERARRQKRGGVGFGKDRGVPGGFPGIRGARIRVDGQRFDLTASANGRQGEQGRLVQKR